VPGVACFLVEHWLFSPGVLAGPVSTPAGQPRSAAARCTRDGTPVRGHARLSTLLGPEGTAALSGVVSSVSQDHEPCRLEGGGVVGPPVF
jgi:hypothetical protein